MQEIEIEIDKLLPIQSGLRSKNAVELVVKNPDLVVKNRIQIMNYYGRFIVGYGHHRVIGRMIAEKTTTPAILFETDEEIRRYGKGGFFQTSMSFFRMYYEVEIRERVEEAGIRTFQDLLLKGRYDNGLFIKDTHANLIVPYRELVLPAR